MPLWPWWWAPRCRVPNLFWVTGTPSLYGPAEQASNLPKQNCLCSASAGTCSRLGHQGAHPKAKGDCKGSSGAYSSGQRLNVGALASPTNKSGALASPRCARALASLETLGALASPAWSKPGEPAQRVGTPVALSRGLRPADRRYAPRDSSPPSCRVMRREAQPRKRPVRVECNRQGWTPPAQQRRKPGGARATC